MEIEMVQQRILKLERKLALYKNFLNPTPEDSFDTKLFGLLKEKHSITKKQIVSYGRKMPLPLFRFMVSKLYRERKLTVHEIGRKINRDYSTVLHHLRAFDPEYKTNPFFKETFDYLKSKL